MFQEESFFHPAAFPGMVMDRVRVAGAGLAGLFAALRLAEGGRSVEIVDVKNRIAPSSGPHSEALRDYVGTEALAELRRYGFDLEPFGTIETTVRKSARYENVLRGRAYHLFLRGRDPNTVDQELYRRCLEAGVKFTFGSRWNPGEPIDIAAAGPPSGEFNILGAGFTFSSDGSNLEKHTAFALLDNDVAPGGYLVVTPGIEYHSIYSVSWGELDYDRLLRMTEAGAARPWVREILGSSRRLGRIYGRAFYAPDPIARAEINGVRYIGEAGGFQDAIAGFGFRYAILTGSLAAKSILEGISYHDLLQATFREEFAIASGIREKLNRFTNEDLDRLVESMGPSMSVDQYRHHRAARFL
ncbi:MAG: hypothetical protein E6K10_00925 [Methanobacteriota archaeon]|nr:MAG: hypothetical protein E6K10_00925 [Euryarchaeota archaeon]